MPLRYVMMGLTVVIVLVFYLLTRKCGFFTYAAFFPALITCMKSLYEKKGEEKKWCVYWVFFSFLEILPNRLDRNLYYAIAKCGALIYFAFFDTCDILINGLNMAYEYVNKGCEYYLGLCQEKCVKTE